MREEKKFSKLIKGGVGIKISRVEKFQKINNRGGTIIRNLRVLALERGTTGLKKIYYWRLKPEINKQTKKNKDNIKQEKVKN